MPFSLKEKKTIYLCNYHYVIEPFQVTFFYLILTFENFSPLFMQGSFHFRRVKEWVALSIQFDLISVYFLRTNPSVHYFLRRNIEGRYLFGKLNIEPFCLISGECV